MAFTKLVFNFKWILVVSLVVTFSGIASAQEGDPEKPKLSFGQLTTDPEDGKFDASRYLGRGGFVPLPIVITDPALGKGLGLALAFVDHSGAANGEDPTVTLLGAAGTVNGSRMAMLGRKGSLGGGDFKYITALAGGSVNLTFFPNVGSAPLEFNNRTAVAYFEGRKRLGNSKFFFGPSLTLNKSNIKPNFDNGNPLPPALSQKITQNALGLVLTYDDRDNHFTPNNGLSFNVSAKNFSPAIGSDSDFVAGKMFGAYFYSPDDRWTFSGMALAEGTFGNAPFFMEPSISLRGVPYNRYQGDRVLSTEFEVRHNFGNRWSVLGFAGYGRTTSKNASLIGGNFDAVVYGAGFRYRLASKFGLDVGVDYAVGPEIDVIYFTFGHAWARHMK